MKNQLSVDYPLETSANFILLFPLPVNGPLRFHDFNATFVPYPNNVCAVLQYFHLINVIISIHQIHFLKLQVIAFKQGIGHENPSIQSFRN